MNSNVISKTFTILRAFTDSKSEWGVNELSRYLKMPVSSTHRMLSMLKEEHILEYSEVTNKYRVGTDFIRMASIISTNVDVKKVARPYLENLASVLHHSVYFALYYPQHKKLSFVDSVKSSFALQYVLDIGVLEPVSIAASGKTILAYLPESEVEEILDAEGLSNSEKKKTKEEIKRIIQLGYAITSNERKQGALSVGAPIFDARKRVIGSIICVVPIADYKEENESLYIKKVKEAAQDISYTLGYLEKGGK
ncbi:IclR family transcriptional regulator [Chungangia koreensis]|uniref:IclR family transcriptional regulator n=1 Tax=Chungangia koreensis TaxID=752657 RepID=A0ABV8X449_9LACT